ncbi:MAG: glycosyltransferase family 39 protein, partial [Smithella sp.]
IINFTLAVNYAISGHNVWSYHLVNLIIHILATLTLFGIIRRTILISKINLNREESLLFSFACALLWGLHPVQTQAVTYVIQRCESLMSLFFLLTVYSALRGWQAKSSNHWHLLAVMFFLLAVFSKEVAIVCPILLISYEWVFQSKNPLRSLKESPLLYSGIFLGCIITFIIVINGNTIVSRTNQTPFTPMDYWVTQCEVIFHYLRLALWPSGLVIDYGWPVAKARDIWPFIAGTLLLLFLSVWSLWQRKVTGFLGVWFFLILAPTSLIPLNDLAFEHRMYLPLAAIIVLIVGIAFNIEKWAQKWFKTSNQPKHSPSFLIILIICAGLILGFLTYQRNYDYRSEIAIWSDTISKRPNNFRGYHGLGLALGKNGQLDDALQYLLHARMINPDDGYVNNDTGFILFLMNKPDESIPFFREAIRLRPNNSKMHNNMGAALAQTGMLKEGIRHFSEALRIKPDYVSARNNLIRASAAYNQSLSENHKN